MNSAGTGNTFFLSCFFALIRWFDYKCKMHEKRAKRSYEKNHEKSKPFDLFVAAGGVLTELDER